jgi:hypothetical protein
MMRSQGQKNPMIPGSGLPFIGKKEQFITRRRRSTSSSAFAQAFFTARFDWSSVMSPAPCVNFHVSQSV